MLSLFIYLSHLVLFGCRENMFPASPPSSTTRWVSTERKWSDTYNWYYRFKSILVFMPKRWRRALIFSVISAFECECSNCRNNIVLNCPTWSVLPPQLGAHSTNIHHCSLFQYDFFYSSTFHPKYWDSAYFQQALSRHLHVCRFSIVIQREIEKDKSETTITNNIN